ncbi:MAG TPA: hypothetical protein VFS42_09355, partial [Burkholderiaceae bacterium]|nr:hypothetical protein [Burkholderiaceae bacterium]
DRLDARRAELINSLARERVNLLAATQALGTSIESANRLRQRFHQATEWLPLGMAVLSAAVMLKKRRASRSWVSWAVELWGLWRTSQTVIQTIRAQRRSNAF